MEDGAAGGTTTPEGNTIMEAKAYLVWCGQEEEVKRFQIDKSGGSSGKAGPVWSQIQENVAISFPQLHGLDFRIAWVDEEGDRVSLSCERDVETVLRQQDSTGEKILRLHIQVLDSPWWKQAEKSKVKSSEEEHPGITCCCCHRPVLGFRYKCLICPNYDMCHQCEGRALHPAHDMVRIPTPRQYPPHFFTRLHRLYERCAHSSPTVVKPCPSIPFSHEQIAKDILDDEVYDLNDFDMEVSLQSFNTEAGMGKQRLKQGVRSEDLSGSDVGSESGPYSPDMLEDLPSFEELTRSMQDLAERDLDITGAESSHCDINNLEATVSPQHTSIEATVPHLTPTVPSTRTQDEAGYSSQTLPRRGATTLSILSSSASLEERRKDRFPLSPVAAKDMRMRAEELVLMKKRQAPDRFQDRITGEQIDLVFPHKPEDYCEDREPTVTVLRTLQQEIDSLLAPLHPSQPETPEEHDNAAAATAAATQAKAVTKPAAVTESTAANKHASVTIAPNPNDEPVPLPNNLSPAGKTAADVDPESVTPVVNVYHSAATAPSTETLVHNISSPTSNGDSLATTASPKDVLSPDSSSTENEDEVSSEEEEGEAEEGEDRQYSEEETVKEGSANHGLEGENRTKAQTIQEFDSGKKEASIEGSSNRPDATFVTSSNPGLFEGSKTALDKVTKEKENIALASKSPSNYSNRQSRNARIEDSLSSFHNSLRYTTSRLTSLGIDSSLPHYSRQTSRVADALEKMQAMGFSDEDGWLTQLLVMKHGDISQVLDILTPVEK